MTILDDITSTIPGFSIEVLPPLKGKSIAGLFDNIERLRPYGPRYVNITTHRSELVYRSVADGLFQRVSQRARPGTVAVAAAIQNRFNIPAVPHLICSGFTSIETEYALIDLNFLGITNLLLLRGDKAHHESRFTPLPGGHAHASELLQQVERFNQGYLIDGTTFEQIPGQNFVAGVAGYPEKHEEAPNFAADIDRLKEKIDLGARYVVTQLFYDNEKFYRFVDACRAAGIVVPIVPGLKPLRTKNQLNILPTTFKVDIPQPLVDKALSAKSADDVAKAGIEWGIEQSQDLIDNGFRHIHYYSLNATPSVEAIADAVFGKKEG